MPKNPERRFHIYLCEGDGERFNAMFAEMDRANREAAWYTNRGYKVEIRDIITGSVVKGFPW